MRSIFTILFFLLMTSNAFAFYGTCQQVSIMAVYAKHPEYFLGTSGQAVRLLDLDPNEITCELAPNGKVNVCDVTGDNGEGAGDVFFRVVLSKNCDKVYSTKLTGKE